MRYLNQKELSKIHGGTFKSGEAAGQKAGAEARHLLDDFMAMKAVRDIISLAADA